MSDINRVLKEIRSSNREYSREDHRVIRTHLLERGALVEDNIKGIAEYLGPASNDLMFTVLIDQMFLLEKYTTMFAASVLYKYSLHFGIPIRGTIGEERTAYLKTLALLHPSDDASSEIDRLLFYSEGLDEERYWEDSGMPGWRRRRKKYHEYRGIVELISEAWNSRRLIPEFFYSKLAERNTPGEIRDFVSFLSNGEFVPEMNTEIFRFAGIPPENDEYYTSAPAQGID